MTGTVGADTSFLIDFFKGDTRAIVFMQTHARMLRVSEIVIYEFLCGNLTQKEKDTVLCALQSFPTVSFNREAALIASDLFREGKKSGRPVGHQDCIVAGSYLAHGIKTIVTKNAKDFSGLQKTLTY